MNMCLQQAFQQAAQLDPHQTTPNPRVGCLITDAQSNILAEGFHARCGDDHAEVLALKSLAQKKYGSAVDLQKIPPLLQNHQVYVTLEPCDCFAGKKTPSCTDLLIYHQPKKIITGSLDPIFGGKNILKLQQAGIEVVCEHYNVEQTKLNPFFPRLKRPYVCLKLAMTLDGKINLDQKTYSDQKPYISNQASREYVQHLRAQYSGILTTTKTVLADNPRFSCRPKKFDRPYTDPDLVVLGDTLIPPGAAIFQIDSSRTITILPRQDLGEVLDICRQQLGLDSLLVEAGQQFSTELLIQNLVDEIVIFVCPQIAGHGLPAFSAAFDLRLFALSTVDSLGQDLVMAYKKTV